MTEKIYLNSKEQMNAVPSGHTTSDISRFMSGLGYKWSNEAQIYFSENSLGYKYMDGGQATQEYLKSLSEGKQT